MRQKDVGLILLNKAGLQAGLGEAAEIYVRSPHLSKGYLGLPEDTAAKFIPNPFHPRRPGTQLSACTHS